MGHRLPRQSKSLSLMRCIRSRRVAQSVPCLGNGVVICCLLGHNYLVPIRFVFWRLLRYSINTRPPSHHSCEAILAPILAANTVTSKKKSRRVVFSFDV